MYANNLTCLKQINIFSTTTGCCLSNEQLHGWHGCLRNEKLLTASVRVKYLVASWNMITHTVIIQRKALTYLLSKSRWWPLFWAGNVCLCHYIIFFQQSYHIPIGTFLYSCPVPLVVISILLVSKESFHKKVVSIPLFSLFLKYLNLTLTHSLAC